MIIFIIIYKTILNISSFYDGIPEEVLEIEESRENKDDHDISEPTHGENNDDVHDPQISR